MSAKILDISKRSWDKWQLYTFLERDGLAKSKFDYVVMQKKGFAKKFIKKLRKHLEPWNFLQWCHKVVESKNRADYVYENICN